MREGNIVYEIRAVVRADLREAWEAYMRDVHVPEVIAAGEFLGASIERDAASRHRIRYLARDRGRLARYLAESAPALREAALRRFPEGVDLAREEWEVVAGW